MSSPANKIAVILTALEVETRAVLRQLGDFTDETVSGTGFFKGRFEGWVVAVAEVGPGNASAAAIAMRAVGHYKPDVALFVGVAGGVKDVAIGDVVVGTKIYGYESGKNGASGFKTRPDLMNAAHDLEQRARILRQRADWKNRLDPAIKHGNSAVRVGPIAAGEKVVASKRAATASLIGEHYGDALAVEMEGRGFLEAVHVSHPVRACVVRGISDLLSGKVNADKAGSQRRAADAASAVAFEILYGLGGDTAADERGDRGISSSSPTHGPADGFNSLSSSARLMLRHAASDNGFLIVRMLGRGDVAVGAGRTQLTQSSNPREIAKWEAAREELLQRNLIAKVNRDGLFKVTDAGYRLVERQLPPAFEPLSLGSKAGPLQIEVGESWRIFRNFRRRFALPA